MKSKNMSVKCEANGELLP